MIPDTELRAINQVLRASGASEIDLTSPSSGEYYYEYRNRQGFKARIAVSCCDGQSNIESAITTQIVLFRHNPRYVFLCGIGGGLKIDKIRLGDVVVSPEVLYRRFTKVEEGGRFAPEVFNVPVSDGGKKLSQRFFSSCDHIKKVQSSLNDGDLFAIHDEKVLSWDLVLDDAATKERLLSDLDRQIAVVEMEGAGFLKAVDSYSRHYIYRPWHASKVGAVDALVVRGISDPAAGKALIDAGQKPWRLIAARNAAQTVLAIIDLLAEKDFGVT